VEKTEGNPLHAKNHDPSKPAAAREKGGGEIHEELTNTHCERSVGGGGGKRQKKKKGYRNTPPTSGKTRLYGGGVEGRVIRGGRA